MAIANAVGWVTPTAMRKAVRLAYQLPAGAPQEGESSDELAARHRS